jgi:hypothetical protein
MERPEQVDLKNPPEAGGIVGSAFAEQSFDMADSGAAHDGAQRSGTACGIHRCTDGVVVGDVSLNGHCAPKRLRNACCGVRVTIDDDHSPTGGTERPGGGSSESRAAADDYRRVHRRPRAISGRGRHSGQPAETSTNSLASPPKPLTGVRQRQRIAARPA